MPKPQFTSLVLEDGLDNSLILGAPFIALLVGLCLFWGNFRTGDRALDQKRPWFLFAGPAVFYGIPNLLCLVLKVGHVKGEYWMNLPKNQFDPWKGHTKEIKNCKTSSDLWHAHMGSLPS